MNLFVKKLMRIIVLANSFVIGFAFTFLIFKNNYSFAKYISHTKRVFINPYAHQNNDNSSTAKYSVFKIKPKSYKLKTRGINKKLVYFIVPPQFCKPVYCTQLSSTALRVHNDC